MNDPHALRYYVLVLKGRLVYDRQCHPVEGFSITTFVREMLANGYGLEIICCSKEEMHANAYQR